MGLKKQKKTEGIFPQGSFEIKNIHLGKWSGQQDSNLRPSGPKPDALARLRYAPIGLP